MVESLETDNLSPRQLPVKTALAHDDILNMVTCGCRVNCTGQCGCVKHGFHLKAFCKCDGECDNETQQCSDDSDGDGENDNDNSVIAH